MAMENEARERITCRGHRNVTARHPTTFEITRDEALTLRGDCIIAVAADRGPAGLSSSFRRLLCRDDAMLETRLLCGGREVTVQAMGSSRFTLSHPADMVWRRSSHADGRTIGIRADHTAGSLPRELVRELQDGAPLTVELRVRVP